MQHEGDIALEDALDRSEAPEPPQETSDNQEFTRAHAAERMRDAQAINAGRY